MCATVRHSHYSIHSVRGPITCRNVADCLQFDGCNESEAVNESGVSEMHEMGRLNAYLSAYISWDENVRLKVEKVHLAI